MKGVGRSCDERAGSIGKGTEGMVWKARGV